MKNEFESKALAANLAETKYEEIHIPEKHLWFTRLSASHWGIHNRTEEFIAEYNHPLANFDFIIDNLHTICLTDLWVYTAIPEAEEALLFLAHIFEEMFEKSLEEKQREQLVKTLFKFVDRMVKEEKFPPKAVWKCLALIESGMGKSKMIYLRNAGYFKTYLKRVAEIPEFSAQIRRLTREVLLKSCLYWKQTANAEAWFEDKKTLFQPIYKDRIRLIGNDFFTEMKDRIEKAKTWEELESNLFFNDIANHFRRFGDEFELPIETIYYLFYVMHVPGMVQLKNHLLYDMNRLLKDAMAGLQKDDVYGLIDTLFVFFGELKEQLSGTILDCLFTLGKEIATLDDAKVVDYFSKKLISFGFIYPGALKINNEWRTMVHVDHVKNIRIWLELIENSPHDFKSLLSALVVNLKLGGIFISDTDLFQRDVTRLLNTEIGPVYKQVKQLAKLFPVYFREIGAEGKLRDTTTAMDELCNRQDKLIHFVRKQIHTESNNTHVGLIMRISAFWYSGDPKPLIATLPKDVTSEMALDGDFFADSHKIMKATCSHFDVDHLGLLALPEQQVLDFISSCPYGNERDRKRLSYLIQINTLLVEKYSLEAGNIIAVLSGSSFFDKPDIEKLKRLMEKNDYNQALNHVYDLMGKLKDIILDSEESIAIENIYYKRHIAIGIPSMYGQYIEPKFEALGLMYRLEKVASKLMTSILSDMKLDYITAKTLSRMYRILNQFKIGLALDGMENQNFNSNLEMMNYSLTSPSFTLGQYINIFEFMAQDIKEIINEYFLRVYDETLGIVVPQIFDQTKETLLKKSENFYREILSSAFLIQQLDNFISDSINKLQNIVDTYSDQYIRNMITYNPDLTFSPFDRPTIEMDNRVFLGAKAYYLKKLTAYNFPIPTGFVLTTEVFRHKDTIFGHPYMSLELEKKIMRNVAEIERVSKLKFGTGKKPMLLSVRSGTAISLPGAMSTFLNVGMNDEVAETLAKNPETAWMGWDAYRRFIQSWGMSNGIERNVFDAVIAEYKKKFFVDQKSNLSPDQMKEIVLEYKQILKDNDVYISDDPYVQLRHAIVNVLDSWDSDRAKSYRKHLQIADEWGTAVIVQKMVMGNRSLKSGSGVVFTHNPKMNRPGINLYGDFTLCSQGEDIVAGLVHTLPISESQRKDDYQDSSMSLQSDFPAVYRRLMEFATELIDKFGFNNQEIEFTFESEDPKDLFILQIREQIIMIKEKQAIFNVPIERMKFAGRGIGIDGGCISGIVSFNMDDMKANKKKNPNKKHILIRPDTVPDDIPIIFICDGLVTGRGGVTSHAAVTAAKLGKVCIVNCRALKVNDLNNTCTINTMIINSGDLISIDGNSGNIYLGRYPIDYI